MPNDWTDAQNSALRLLAATASSWKRVAIDMQAARPGLTADAASKHAKRRLGLRLSESGQIWTPEQDAILIPMVIEARCQRGGWCAIAKRLQDVRPGVTWDGVRERARRLGLCEQEMVAESLEGVKP